MHMIRSSVRRVPFAALWFCLKAQRTLFPLGNSDCKHRLALATAFSPTSVVCGTMIYAARKVPVCSGGARCSVLYLHLRHPWLATLLLRVDRDGELREKLPVHTATVLYMQSVHNRRAPGDRALRHLCFTCRSEDRALALTHWLQSVSKLCGSCLRVHLLLLLLKSAQRAFYLHTRLPCRFLNVTLQRSQYTASYPPREEVVL